LRNKFYCTGCITRKKERKTERKDFFVYNKQ
jgi:hypothetical protein